VPDPAFRPYEPIDLGEVDRILDEHDYDPAHMLAILEATQEAYGYLPVAALKRISHRTGAWYAIIYGTASYYGHLRFEPPTATDQAAAVDAHRPAESTYIAALGAALEGGGRAGASARA
jgi:2Fe-2S thioredoxin-like protein